MEEEEPEITSENIPKPESSSFFSDFEERGFSKEETVALGALLAYGRNVCFKLRRCGEA